MSFQALQAAADPEHQLHQQLFYESWTRKLQLA
jgi:hypothetical protein